MPQYVKNIQQYTSASAAGSGSAFTHICGGNSFQINHSNDATGAGTSEGSVFTIQGGDDTDWTEAERSLGVYLNGVRLLSGSGLDYFVTGSAVISGGKPAILVDFQNVLLQTGDTVVMDFQMNSD